MGEEQASQESGLPLEVPKSGSDYELTKEALREILFYNRGVKALTNYIGELVSAGIDTGVEVMVGWSTYIGEWPE